MSLLDRIKSSSYISYDEEANRIIYKNTKFGDHKQRFSDPEEQVRANVYLDLIEKYQYESRNIGLEVEMPKRVPNHFADLVIYEPSSDSRYFVIEFKKADVSDNEFEQAVKQGIGNGRVLAAKFYGTIAGETVRFFEAGKDEKGKDAFYAIPVRYGNPEEWTYTKGGVSDLEPVTMESLETALAKAHQTIWHGGKRNPAEAFGEVAKIIFVKVWDERKLRKQGDPYEFQKKRNETAERLEKRIHAIYHEAKERDPQVFSEDIKLNAKELSAVVEHLQKLNLSKTDLDVKGEAFQKFLGNFFKGDFGQYFTPSTAVQFCVDMLADEITEHHNVLDTSCGSGGFLLRVLDLMRSKANEFFADDPAKHFAFWHGFAEKRLFGIEISEAIARVAKMNMILHDDGHTNVISHDGLDSIEKMSKINLEFRPENFDFIFTNPPFGATVKDAESDYLDSFELGKNGKKTRPTQKTEILFLERAWQFLKPGGQMAIVLPDGILTNASLQYVRDYILEKYKLRAVVSLTGDAFKYYGAGVKSSILFLQKWKGKPAVDYKVFMAIADKIGVDASGRKCENELPGIVEQFKVFNGNSEFYTGLKGKKHIATISRSEIEGRIDSDFYKKEFLENYLRVKKFPHDKLGNLVKFSQDTWDQKSLFKDTFPYIEISSINLVDGIIEETEQVKIEEAPSRAKKIVRKNDIIVSTTRPNRGAIARIQDLHDGNICSTGFAVIREYDARIKRDFIFWMLKSEKILLQMMQRSSGGNYPAITEEELLNILIPLPPLEIQQQIVDLMDRAITEKQRLEQEAIHLFDCARADAEKIIVLGK